MTLANDVTSMKEKTPCAYEKSLYLFSTSGVNEIIKPLEAVNMSIEVNCNYYDIFMDYGTNNGVIMVDKTRQTPFYNCFVKCQADDNKFDSGYTSLAIKVSDNKPIYSEIGSSYPIVISSSKKFSISIKLLYPSDQTRGMVTVEIKFQRTKICSLPESKKITTNENYVTFKDLMIYCRGKSNQLINIQYRITTTSINNGYYGYYSINKFMYVKPAVPMKYENSVTENYDINNLLNFYYFCDSGIEADVFGLCCERDVEAGESCNKVIYTLSFDGRYYVNNYEWIRFAKSYLDTLRRYVFNNTNFNFVDKTEYYYDDKKYNTIRLEITFYEYKIWIYDYDEYKNEIVERSLQSIDNLTNWKILSTPYLYINTLLSFINPALLPEINNIENDKKEESY